MPVLNQQAIANNYPASPGTGSAALGNVWNSRGGWLSITGASAYVQLQYGDQGSAHWTEEILLGNGAFIIVPPNCRGMQFRNAVANQVATVTAQIAQGDEPPLSVTTIGVQNVVSVASLNFQRNDVAVATEPTVDFMDAAGVITWAVVDDAANTRVRVTPAFTSPALFPGSVGVGGNAGDTTISRLAAGVIGASNFSTGPTSSATGGGGITGVFVTSAGRVTETTTLATDFVDVSAITTDTQGRFARDSGGTMTWGAGGASARDVTLTRSAAGTMTWTLNQLTVDTSGAGSGITNTTNGTGFSWRTFTSGDANPRYSVSFAGTLAWGAGGASATDTSLARDTNSPPGLNLTGALWATAQVVSAMGGSGAGTAFNAIGAATGAALNSGGVLQVSRAAGNPALTVTNPSATTDWRFQLDTAGGMKWAAANTANDTVLSRTGVGILNLTSVLTLGNVEPSFLQTTYTTSPNTYATNAASAAFYNRIIQSVVVTSTVNISAPTNPPTANFSGLLYYDITNNGTGAMTLNWNAIFTATTVTIPTSLAAGTSTRCLYIYNPTANTWNLILKV